MAQGLLPATPAQVAAVTVESFLTMDTWLTNLLTTAPKPTLNSVRTQAQVIAGKPATAYDLCYLTGDPNFTTKVTDMALCDADPRLKSNSSPRQVAGGSLSENVLKCQLKPLNAGRLCADDLHVHAMGTAAGHLPGRRVRLEQAGCGPAGGAVAVDFRRRARRSTVAARTDVWRALKPAHGFRFAPDVAIAMCDWRRQSGRLDDVRRRAMAQTCANLALMMRSCAD